MEEDKGLVPRVVAKWRGYQAGRVTPHVWVSVGRLARGRVMSTGPKTWCVPLKGSDFERYLGELQYSSCALFCVGWRENVVGEKMGMLIFCYRD